MTKKIKDKAAIAARKRERKANSLAFGGNNTPIEIIPTKKIVTIGYRNIGKTTVYDSSKCPVTAELERTARVVAQVMHRYSGQQPYKANFTSNIEVKIAVKEAIEAEDVFKLFSIWKELTDNLKPSKLFADMLESVHFAYMQLIAFRISWWNIKVFFNNHYNLGIKI